MEIPTREQTPSDLTSTVEQLIDTALALHAENKILKNHITQLKNKHHAAKKEIDSVIAQLKESQS